MIKKKNLLLKISAALTAVSICLGIMPITAAASEMKKEYEVTGKIAADGPMFNDQTTIDIANGYYVIYPDSDWYFFSCESADGKLKFNYFLEKDNIYRFCVIDQGKNTTYYANDAGILLNNETVKGTVFHADGYNLDFTNLIFTEAKERPAEGIYEATGTNTLGADYILVKVYDTVLDIDFYKSGKQITNLGGNYTRIDTAGTITFTHDYEGFFTGNLTTDDKLYGNFISANQDKQIDFDLQLKEANTITSGSYLARGDFFRDIDGIRIHFIGMNFDLELLNADHVVKSYQLCLDEIKQDGTLVLVSYNGSELISKLEISADGTVTGKLYAEYNADINVVLTKLNEANKM